MTGSSFFSKLFIVICVISQAFGTYFVIYGSAQRIASAGARQMILIGIALVIVPLIIEGISMYALRKAYEE